MKKIGETLTILIEQYSIREKRLQLNLLASLFFLRNLINGWRGGVWSEKNLKNYKAGGETLTWQLTVQFPTNLTVGSKF